MPSCIPYPASRIPHPVSRILSLCLCASVVLSSALCFAGAAISDPGPQPPGDAVAVHLKAGRRCLQRREYAAALGEFSLALALKPKHPEARFLAGLAAYWAHDPRKALEHWDALLDSAQRNSAEEWKIETSRVMALAALDQFEAAEQVVARLYELRKTVPEAKRSSDFVREHLLIGDCCIWCRETFDEKHEAQELWTFPVMTVSRASRAQAGAAPAVQPADEQIAACLAVAAATFPDGKAGFVLNEEGPGYKRIYKRWATRPAYAEVRAALVDILQTKTAPLEEKKADNAANFPEIAATVTLPWHAVARRDGEGAGQPPADARGSDGKPTTPKQREPTEAELGLAAKVQSWGLDPEPTRILTVAAKLRDVDFDVTRLTRLSLTDTLLASRCLEELNAKAPYAQEDAAELVEVISKAKVDHVRAACGRLGKLGPRQPYLDYALLTAFTTRGRDVPIALLKELQKSPDFMVRQTAALLWARAGDQRGLAQLFKEIELTDALGGAILQGSIEELAGQVLGAPPAARAAAPGAGLDLQQEQAFKAWQQKAAAWWLEHGARVKFADGQWTTP